MAFACLLLPLQGRGFGLIGGAQREFAIGDLVIKQLQVGAVRLPAGLLEHPRLLSGAAGQKHEQ